MLTPLAFDTETDLITPWNQIPDMVCLSYYVGGVPGLFHWSDPDLEEKLWSWLKRDDILWIGHNIAFDFCVVGKLFPHFMPRIVALYEADRVTDTEIRQKLGDIAGGVYRGFEDADEHTTIKINYTLEDVALRLLKRQLDKNTWRLRYGEFKYVTLDQWPEGAREYPKEDARATGDVWETQEPITQFLEDQFRQARAAFWIQLMKAWGLRTDEAMVLKLRNLAQAKLDDVSTELRSIGLLRHDKRKRDGTIEPGSRDTKLAQRMIAEAYARRGLEVPLTDGGKSGNRKPCLDKKTCKESGDPVMQKYGSIGEIKSILSTNVPLLLKGVYEPIHPYFEVLLETGRTSSKPNVQNFRRKKFEFGGLAIGIRECLIPRDGYVFASADYSGLELCTLAEVCMEILGYSSLAQAINNDRDAHLMVASQILGQGYDYLKTVRDTGSPHDFAIKVDDARQTGKVGNFGFPGGLGPDAFVQFADLQYDVKLTRDQAVFLKQTWIATWPEMPDYFAHVNRLLNSSPFPQVRQLYSNRYRGGLKYTEACNTYFQGLGADIAKHAGWLIMRACYVDVDSPLFGCRIVNFIHDEFVVEAPEHRAHESAIELSRLMLVAASQWLRHVKIKAEPCLMRRYSKDAKPKRDKQTGRLIPWEPALQSTREMIPDGHAFPMAS